MTISVLINGKEDIIILEKFYFVNSIPKIECDTHLESTLFKKVYLLIIMVPEVILQLAHSISLEAKPFFWKCYVGRAKLSFPDHI